MSSLPYSFFVGYSSTQLKVAGGINRLNAIVITKPTQRLSKFVSVYSSSETYDKYGVTSKERNFADKFFEFQNKNGNFADILTFYNLYDTTQPAILQGAKLSDLNSLKKAGRFKVSLNGESKEVSVDLSNLVSYTDMANKIQEAINALGNEVIQTSIDIATSDNTELSVEKGADGAATQELTITTNAKAYDITSEKADIAKVDKNAKDNKKATITGLKAGETKIHIIARADNLNKVEIVVNVNVTEEGADKAKVLKVATTLENLKVIESSLNITTNADSFEVEVKNVDVATFDKATNLLKPLKEGECVLNIKATKNKEVVREVVARVANDLNVTFDIKPYTKEADIPLNPAFKNATFKFNSVNSNFELRSGQEGEGSLIDYISSVENSDLATLLCMRDVDGAVVIQGQDAGNFETALNDITLSNGNYYSISVLFDLDNEQLKTFASIIAQTKGRFLGIISKYDKRILSEINPFAELLGYDGIIANCNPTQDIDLSALTQSFIASLDLSQANSVINMNFVPATKYDSANTIYTSKDMNNLNKNRVNGIFAVGDFGERKVYYGEGEIFGETFTSANSYIWNSFIKFNIEKAMFFQLANSTHVGARNPNDIKLLVDIATNQCENFANAGIIVRNAVLSEAEIIVLKKALNGDSNDYNSCINNGYVLKFVKNSVNDLTNKITSEFNLVYIENKATNRIKIASVFI